MNPKKITVTIMCVCVINVTVTSTPKNNKINNIILFIKPKDFIILL